MSDAPAPARPVLGALRGLFRDAAKLDRTQSDPVIAGRNALGLVLPLSVAAALGSSAIGVQAAIGALQTAFADRPGPYRLRMTRMAISASAAALTAGVAAAIGHSLVLSAVLLAVCGFSAGLLVIFGPSASQVGVAATGCALILGHIPETPLAALRTAGYVLIGGMVQLLLAITAWPLRRHGPERRSLAALYEQLGELAMAPVGVRVAPPLSPAISQARAVLKGAGHDHGPSVEAYRVLFDQAVRARQDVLVLSAYALQLQDEGQAASSQALHDALGSTGAVLRRIATGLADGAQPELARRQETQEIIDAIAPAALPALGTSLAEHAARDRLASLVSQLRAMARTAVTGAGEGRTDEDAETPGVRARLRDPLAVLRANLDVNSPALRHAARLGLLIPLTDIVTRAAGWDRGYWVSLTILVVLRPDFGSTFQRSLQRVIGTVLGLLLASLLVHYLLHDGLPALVVLIAISFFGVRLAGPNNVGLSALCLAGVVVVLLSIAGIPAHTTVVSRTLATVLGGAIALVASLLWPKWERSQIGDSMADLIGAYRDFLASIVDSAGTASARAGARTRARLARSNAEASLDRARSEPVDSQGAVELGAAVLANSHRLVHALTALDATRRGGSAYDDVTEFRELIDAAALRMRGLQRALRGAVLVEDPGLRRRQEALVATYQVRVAAARAEPSSRFQEGAALVEACDRMVDSLDTMTAAVVELRAPSSD